MVYAASSEACWQLMEDDNMRVSIKERMLVLERLGKLGLGYDEAQALRRISMTLQRWGMSAEHGL